MKFTNYTPFPAQPWEALHHNGNLYGVVVVRGKFKFWNVDEHNGHWDLRPDPDQGELFEEDQFYGGVGTSSVRYESDYIPAKAATDLILNVNAYSPNNQLIPKWNCSVKLISRTYRNILQKELTITGKRYWKRTLMGWTLTTPENEKKIAIRYEKAFGGGYMKKSTDPEKDDNWLSFCEQNPVGVGKLHAEDPEKYQAAPQIEVPENPIKNPKSDYTPEGFGATHRSWQPRLSLAGTYDDKWLKDHHPNPPEDFQFRHNNGAHRDLIVSGYMVGNEGILLNNLSPNNSHTFIRLPDYRVLRRIKLSNGGQTLDRLNLDTVLLDMDDDDPENWRVYLSWRGQHVLMDEATELETMLVKSYGIYKEKN